MIVDAKRWTAKGSKALADAMGVTTRTITRLKNAGMPVNEDGTFDVEACKAFSRRRISKAQSRNRRGISATDLDDLDEEQRRDFEELEDLRGSALDEASIRAQTRYRLIKAQREQIQLRKDEGDLIEKTEVDRHQGQMFTSLRRRFMAMGRRLGPDCAGQAARIIQTKIEAEVASILKNFATEKDQPE